MKRQFKIKNITKGTTTGIMSILLLLLIFSISCEKEDVISDYNPPSDHTISKDGVMHKNGLNQPINNCASCHGQDLKGGSTGVSCFECHGKKW